MECIEPSALSREQYLKLFHYAVVREAAELDGKLQPNIAILKVIFDFFYDNILSKLRNTGRKEPPEALSFWEEQNGKPRIISPLLFNGVARACLASHVSLASAKRLFSDFGKVENRQSQSLLSSTLEMSEVIQVFALKEPGQLSLTQTGWLHLTADIFRCLVDRVAIEVQLQE